MHWGHHGPGCILTHTRASAWMQKFASEKLEEKRTKDTKQIGIVA